MRRRDMILLKQSVWIFNSAFYGSQSGSQIGSWGTDSSKLLLSSKFSIVVTVFVILINSHYWKMWFWGFRFLISLIFGRKGPGTGFLCRFPLQQCQQPIWNYCISSTTTLCLGFYKDVVRFIADNGCTLVVFLGLWSLVVSVFVANVSSKLPKLDSEGGLIRVIAHIHTVAEKRSAGDIFQNPNSFSLAEINPLIFIIDHRHHQHHHHHHLHHHDGWVAG